MDILLNGQPRQIAEASTLLDLLNVEGLQQRRLAIEVNQQIIPRYQHAEHRLKPGDRVEIVQAMGGG
ncbi:MAG: sulfur carrier protein ThiS [Pseudomonadota bacterium]|nr:sulfur carrier protein ThiS [Pseudomonadota bacterium]